MHSIIIGILAGVAAILLLALLLLFMIYPGKCPKDKQNYFLHRNYAHRGLHTKDKLIPENSLAAFRRAVEAGYGIELDIQLTKDRQIVVFHDSTLNRVCHVKGRVDSFTYEELRQFQIEDTNERIPLFSDVLKLVDGKVPLLVELKHCYNNRYLCSQAYKMLTTYGGPYCIESFNPFIVGWFRKHAPHVLRGQLSTVPKGYHNELPAIAAFLLGNLLTNFLARPQFIAYDKVVGKPKRVAFKAAKKPLSLSICQALGAARAVWTVRTQEEAKYFEKNKDIVIFEHYLPSNRF